MKKLLNQPEPLTRLTSLSLEALKHIDNQNLKVQLAEVIELFNHAICPSLIHISDVFQVADKYNISISEEQAMEILYNASLDIDLNYTKHSVEYHFNELFCNN